MPGLLLSTKLQAPQIRLERVRRPRLVARLQQGLASALTLVSAPAGFGKTTLICEWLAVCGRPSAWISLDRGDNDPARFWGYVVAALQGAPAFAGRTLPDLQTSPNLPANEALITELVNALDSSPREFVLVLDDYHLIESQAIHEGIRLLLEHAPAHFHLVIATRADPPLPLGRLRARAEMWELRQADLSFTALEATEFLNHTMGLHLSPEDIARLTDRTEGWIAGLQMAALSMQNTDDVSAFISTFTGSHHYIFDYLLEEILERQSREIRRFLLYTSIPDRLTGALCDALFDTDAGASRRRSSASILEELERSNLFIVRLDPERRWYRYHALFSELLRGYLQQNYADQVPILHARASAWFEGQGLFADAIHHALLAGDWERVTGLISANVFALLEQNELNAVARKLDNLAGERSLARSWLRIARAWLAAYTGQLSTVESMLDEVEAEIEAVQGQASQRTLHGHCAAIRAFSAWSGGRWETGVRAAREALEYLDPVDRTIRCLSATVLGLSLDDLDERERAFDRALDYARGGSISHVVLFAHSCRAYLLVSKGRLHEAQAACHEAIELARSASPLHPLPTLSHVYSTVSLILYEWNDLEGALQYAREAVALARRWEQADALHFAYTNLGSALFARGDTQAAFDTLQQAWQVARRTSCWFEEITIAQEVEWHLAQGNLEAAVERLRLAEVQLGQSSRVYKSPLLALTYPQTFLAQKRYAKALTSIAAVLDDLQKRKNHYYLVRVLVWQAMAYQGLGQKAQALAALKQALIPAAPQGFIRTFIAAGPALVPLLQQTRTAGIAHDYVDRLLAAMTQEDQPQPSQGDSGPRLIEPLSEREMEVLKLLARGCRDKQIAETLVIARGTVHKHLKNIYGKLDVHSRTEAIARARELSLL